MLLEESWPKSVLELPDKSVYTFTFMHLADAFIQSVRIKRFWIIQIQAIHFFYQYVCSLGIEPTTFCAANAMLYHWATGTHTATRQLNAAYVCEINIFKLHLTLSLPLMEFSIIYETTLSHHWQNFPAFHVFTGVRQEAWLSNINHYINQNCLRLQNEMTIQEVF